jgi:Baseplate J-like protein
VSDSGRLAKPGQLRYRAGTYRTFLAAMQRGARLKPPLATLNIETAGDLTNALMSGWARLCDVLTFYQERIANEAYLPTATEPMSVLCLAAQIGERRKPAVGARTSLALQLIDAAGQPDSLTVEPGPSLAVQSAPASPDTLPVVFEGAERIELRPAWNALPLAIEPVPLPPSLWPGCRSLRLVGTATGIRPGSALLLDVADGPSWLAIVETVQVDRSLGCTLIAWRTPVSAPPGWSATVTAVTLFATTTGLFGRTAMEWADVPEKQKEAIGVRAGGIMLLDRRGFTADPGVPDLDPGPPLWRVPPQAMVPPPDIQALLAIGGETLLAGTGNGLFRSVDGGRSWHPLTLPQRRRASTPPQGRYDVRALSLDSNGTIYAGTEEGVALTSADGGETWTLLTQAVGPPTPRIGRWAGMMHLFDRPKKPPRAQELWTMTGPIRAMTARVGEPDALPDIYAGTDQGVFVLLAGAAHWQPFNEGLSEIHPESGGVDAAVAALALVDGKYLVSATNRGLFFTPPGVPAWQGAGERTECSSLATHGVTAFVGTSAGVLAFAPPGQPKAFNALFVGAPPPVYSLALFDSELYAATAGGFYVTRTDAAGWRSLDVQEVTLFEMDGVFAKDLDEGWLSTLRRRFARFGIELDSDIEVRSLFLPGTNDVERLGWQLREVSPHRRIFRIYREGVLRVTQLVRNRAGAADLLAAADGGLLASLPIGPVLNAEWPDFAITTGEARIDGLVRGAEIFLDRKADGIEAGSRIVLAPAGTSLELLPEVHSVIASDSVLHKAFGQQRTVTQIIVRATAELLSADLRTTNVYAASRAIAPFTATNPDLRPLAGDVLVLPGIQSGLAPGRSLLVSGPRPGAVILPNAAGPGCWEERLVAQAGAEAGPALDQQMVSPGLMDAFAAAGIKLSPGAGVSVVAPGARWLVRDGDRAWRLDLPPDADAALPLRIVAATLYEVVAQAEADDQFWTLVGGDETLIVPCAEAMVVRAASSQASLSEIAILAHAAIDLQANVTEIRLTAPLGNLYDPVLCRICANVVPATQGETVHEVLGSGRPAKAPQSFALLRSPLTHVRDWEGDGARSELRVEVNGRAGRALRFGGGTAPQGGPAEHWLEIPSLALAESWERVHAVAIDEAGRATLQFGDGVHGAPVPSGNDNVAATYRWGAGALGNVPAGTLIALRKRPAGIRSVTNPVAASGGADAEAIEALRERAPRRLSYCRRIVTLADYEAFARNFPGVGRAYAALIEAAEIRLTLATDDWRPVSQAPGLRHSLAVAIEASRADRLALRLEDPYLVAFDVALSIAVDPDADRWLVAGQVRGVLAGTFGAGRCDFGQPVEPRRVIEAAGRVPGVRSATLTALHRTGAPEPRLSPLAAGPDEWLVVNAATGIAIAVQP